VYCGDGRLGAVPEAHDDVEILAQFASHGGFQAFFIHFANRCFIHAHVEIEPG